MTSRTEVTAVPATIATATTTSHEATGLAATGAGASPWCSRALR
jgi:hypothetical protein